MICHVLALNKVFVGDFRRFVHPPKTWCLCAESHLVINWFQSAASEPLRHEFVIVSICYAVVRAPPFVLRTPRFADAVEPSVQRLVMILDGVVFSPHESIAVMIAHLVDRGA